ncbi:MAG: phosphatase PAP2 family protein [Bacteroidia bacterium]|nr:phosphatase PAP2 family protein [Bacteroidia bacterium]MBP9181027.1 phosphatase PAP2 family protein [Bacteroidia bacterium]
MISILYQLDRELFYFINGSCDNAFFNLIMPWMRNMYFWFPLYAVIIGYIIYSFKKKAPYVLLMVALTVTASDQLSGNLMKKSVKRLRPCNNVSMEGYVIERVTCGSGYSFTSAHASNHFSLAVLIIFLFASRFRWVKWAAPLWAATISFAQVYVGVHFPADVTVGALFGILIALLMIRIFKPYILEEA